MVEYILLLAVVASLIMTFYNSDFFKRMFGGKGVMGTRIKQSSEYSYRHAYQENRAEPYPANAKEDPTRHPSYHEPGVGTRFFGPRENYP